MVCLTLNWMVGKEILLCRSTLSGFYQVAVFISVSTSSAKESSFCIHFNNVLLPSWREFRNEFKWCDETHFPRFKPFAGWDELSIEPPFYQHPTHIKLTVKNPDFQLNKID